MGWVTLSLRKMVMTRRVSALEHRLTKLSQEQQSLANGSSYDERAIGLDKQDAYANLTSQYSDSLTNISNSIGNGDGTVTDLNQLAQYQVQLQQSQLDYMYNKMLIDSVFTQKEQALQDAVNSKQTYLECEQKQVETQLQAARAELQQLDEACSQDIQNNVISLV